MAHIRSQAIANWSVDSTNEFTLAGYVQHASPSRSVTISNPITYPDWVQEYRTNLMLIKITSSQADVDWRVDVYGQTGTYLGSFTNHSTSGAINIGWDLKIGGVPQTDSTFYTVTTITPTGLAPAAVTQTNPPLVLVVDNYPDEGMWIVARASYMPTNLQNYDLYVDTANGFAQMGEAAGGVLPGSPYRLSGEALVLSRVSHITNWSAMARALTNKNVRNFYFDGHGGPDFIGYNYTPDGRITPVTSSTVRSFLGNTQASPNATRYRWVWIDSCESALGDWPSTFGMGNRENVPLSSYTSRPAAFCGFNKEVYAYTPFHFGNTIDINSINYRSYFLLYWNAFEYGLKTSFDNAASSSGFSDAQYLNIYGYWGLHWDEFNTKSEWP